MEPLVPRSLIAVASLPLLLAVACRSATEPLERRLELSVAVSRASFVRGDTVRVTVTVRNPTSLPITISGSSSCLLAFHVLDARGREVTSSDAICTMDLVRVTIPAGGTRTNSQLWAGYEASGEAPLDPLPAGVYQVVGELNADGAVRIGGAALVEVREP